MKSNMCGVDSRTAVEKKSDPYDTNNPASGGGGGAGCTVEVASPRPPGDTGWALTHTPRNIIALQYKGCKILTFVCDRPRTDAEGKCGCNESHDDGEQCNISNESMVP